jgi:hypothetical protein
MTEPVQGLREVSDMRGKTAYGNRVHRLPGKDCDVQSIGLAIAEKLTISTDFGLRL